MIWEIFYWPMGKSRYSIIPNEETIELTSVLQSMRTPSLQCEEPIKCAWRSRRLTSVTTFRLNSRDHLRERSTTDKAENAYGLSSFRIAQGGTADKCGSKPTAVSISVHHSETTDFPEVKHNHDVESTTAPR
jgi:hypothetical protein